MAAQIKLAQMGFPKMKGVAPQRTSVGISTNGVTQGRDRGANVQNAQAGGTVGMSLTEQKKVMQCHGCGEYGHWICECPYKAHNEGDKSQT